MVLGPESPRLSRIGRIVGRALGLMIISLLVTSFGTVTLAAYGIGSNVLQVVTIPALGLSTAAAMRKVSERKSA